jgi:hypothetical protein
MSTSPPCAPLPILPLPFEPQHHKPPSQSIAQEWI